LNRSAFATTKGAGPIQRGSALDTIGSRPQPAKEKPMSEETTPQPRIAQKSPYIVDEQPGKKSWCACGLSNYQPFCDGSHTSAPGISPIVFTAEKSETVYFCGCKHSANKPYCDGTHNKLD